MCGERGFFVAVESNAARDPAANVPVILASVFGHFPEFAVRNK
jgi:hypothetical protein